MKLQGGLLGSQKGFTFVELLIAVALVVMALVGIMGANLLIQQSSETAYQRSVAIQDASRAIEKIRVAAATGTFPNNVTSAYPNNQNMTGFSNLTSETVNVHYASTTTDPLDVTVTVTWQTTQNRSETIILKSIVTKRIVL